MAKRYSPQFKFQVVMEVLTGERLAAQVAKAYDVHPNTVAAWKRALLEKGAEIFGQQGTVKEYEKRIAELEQLVGKKEVEIALCGPGEEEQGPLRPESEPAGDRSPQIDVVLSSERKGDVRGAVRRPAAEDGSHRAEASGLWLAAGAGRAQREVRLSDQSQGGAAAAATVGPAADSQCPAPATEWDPSSDPCGGRPGQSGGSEGRYWAVRGAVHRLHGDSVRQRQPQSAPGHNPGTRQQAGLWLGSG